MFYKLSKRLIFSWILTHFNAVNDYSERSHNALLNKGNGEKRFIFHYIFENTGALIHVL